MSPPLLYPAFRLMLPTAEIAALTTIVLAILLSIWKSTKEYSAFEPPTVPSYLPWIGSAWSYSHDTMRFMRACSDKYGSVFKFVMCGNSIVAISSPTAYSNFLRDRSGAFDVIDYLYVFTLGGNNKSGRKQEIWETLNRKAFTAARRGLSQRSLTKAATTLNHLLFDGIHSFILDGSKIVPVQEFTQKVLYVAIMRSLYGPHFPADFSDDLIAFDSGIPYLLRSVPFLAPAAIQARERLVARFVEYISNSWREDECGGYLEGASEAISDIVGGLKSGGLTMDEISRLMTPFFWGSLNSPGRVGAWVLRYLVTNPEVYDRLREEIRGARTTAYTHIQSFLSLEPRDLDHQRFSLLTSFVKEVMRVTLLLFSARIALKDVHIPDDDGKSILIREGEIVLGNVSSLQYSSDRYENPEEFQLDRFSFQNKRYGGDERYFKPFGTGSRVCPGKNLAMHTLRMLVILCVEAFDIRAAPNCSGNIPDLPKFNCRLFTPVPEPDKEIDIVISQCLL